MSKQKVTAMTYTSLRVKQNTKEKLQQVAIEISFLTGKQITWSELANMMFDKYSEQVKKDLTNKKEK